MVTAFEMGMSEDEFWRCVPRVFSWRVEAFIRGEIRRYESQLHIAATAAGAKDMTPFGYQYIWESMRLGEKNKAAGEAIQEVRIATGEIERINAVLDDLHRKNKQQEKV